jgi:hypothetical protein
MTAGHVKDQPYSVPTNGKTAVSQRCSMFDTTAQLKHPSQIVSRSSQYVEHDAHRDRLQRAGGSSGKGKVDSSFKAFTKQISAGRIVPNLCHSNPAFRSTTKFDCHLWQIPDHYNSANTGNSAEPITNSHTLNNVSIHHYHCSVTSYNSARKKFVLGRPFSCLTISNSA